MFNVLQEQEILLRIRDDNKEAFTLLYRCYYTDLVLFCGNFMKERENCEDIVQIVFLKLWNDRKTIQIESSLKSYLLRAVRNSCYDEFRHQEVIRQHQNSFDTSILGNYDTENYVLHSDLSTHLQDALQKLPESFRKAFILNRIDGLKYKEIADQLDVSVRTVEMRISKALELLRKQLKEFLIFLFFVCFH